jgi:hypothetical protein
MSDIPLPPKADLKLKLDRAKTLEARGQFRQAMEEYAWLTEALGAFSTGQDKNYQWGGAFWGAIILGVVAGPWAAPIGAYAGWKITDGLGSNRPLNEEYMSLYRQSLLGLARCQEALANKR